MYAVRIKTLERVRAFINGVMAGVVAGVVLVVFKLMFFVFSEKDKPLKEYIEKQNQCYTYQEAIEKLKGELVYGNPNIIKKFNTLVDKFNQLNCPDVIFRDYYSTRGER